MREFNYELKQLCLRNRDGSFSTRANRERILELIANQLHELGFKNMHATSLKAKHVSALVATRTGATTAAADDAAGGADLHKALEGADLADAPGGGVLVRSIEPGSSASQTQLKANDVITIVNRKPVANVKELRAAVKEQSSLLLTVRRGETTVVVPVR